MTENLPDAGEIVDVLASRDDVLGELSSGPEDIRDLKDEIGCSRSTAYKAVRELQSRELVEGADGEYRLTLLGRLLFERYRRFLDEADEILAHSDVFATLSPDLPIDPSVFADATVVTPDSFSPDRAVDALEAFIAEATRFRFFTSVTRDRYRAFGTRLLEREGLSFEAIHERKVLEYVISKYPDQIRRFIESDRTTYYQTEASFPFGLVVVDEPERRVGITLYDDDTQLRAFISADGAEAYVWADELYESYRRDAARLTAADLGDDADSEG